MLRSAVANGWTGRASELASARERSRGVRDLIGDEELLDRVRSGEDRAFEVLYTRYHLPIAAYARRLVGDHGRAEDVTQEVFISALRRIRATSGPIAFRPWLYEIARNACIDQFRGSRRRTQEVSLHAARGQGGADPESLVAQGGAPEAIVDTKQRLDHVCHAFAEISDSHHEILVMRELEGRSYREIEERMKLSRAGVESTLFRARRRLAEEYDALVTGRRCLSVQETISAAGTRTPGLRDQRRLASHLSHCARCRRRAHEAGRIDLLALNTMPSPPSRLGALLAMPASLSRWLAASGPGRRLGPPHGSGVSNAALSGATPALGAWGRAAGAVVALSAAGMGGGMAAGVQHRAPRRADPAPGLQAPPVIPARPVSQRPAWSSRHVGDRGASRLTAGLSPRPPAARPGQGRAQKPTTAVPGAGPSTPAGGNRALPAPAGRSAASMAQSAAHSVGALAATGPGTAARPTGAVPALPAVAMPPAGTPAVGLTQAVGAGGSQAVDQVSRSAPRTPAPR